MIGRSSREVERLVAAERAARVAGESAARWWRDLTQAAATARTDRALDDIFRSSLGTLKEALDADVVSVLIANDAADELVARASNGLSEEITLDLAIRSGEGMAGRVLASGRPLLVEDLSTINVVSPVLRNSGMRSIAAVPILWNNKILGVLYAGSHELNHFGTVDIELLELMASRFAEALERVEAFEAERLARERAERNSDHLVRLQRITSKLLSATTPEEIAATLTDSLATDSLGVDVAWSSVWLLRTGTLTLVPTPRSLPMSEALREISVDAKGPIARTFRDKCANFATTDEDDGANLPEDGQLLYTSWAALPLLVRQDCIGVVVVAHRQAHQFAQDERDFLTAMAEQSALAIERARLYAAQVALSDMNAFFAQSARAIAEGTDFADTLDRLANLALHVLGDICLIDVVAEDGQQNRMIARHRDESKQPLVDRLRREFPPDPLGSHPAVEVIRSGKTRWSEEMSEDFLDDTTRDQAHLEVVKELAFHSYIAVPLTGDGEVIGALTLVSCSRSFQPSDVSFAERLAEHVAAVVDNARRYESTVQTSHILQESLLPKRLRAVPGLSVFTRYLPATRGLEVGGDFYDLLVLPSGIAGFTIGDVAGHDREAAALMGQFRSAARALAAQVSGPAELIETLRWSWDMLGFDRLTTALFGTVDPRTGDLVIASAGHYPPLLVSPTAANFVPVAPSEPLGMRSTRPGSSAEWRGQMGDDHVLLLYTDGAIDERDAGPEASMQQMIAAALAGDTGNLESVCERIVRTLPLERIDDVALLAIGLDHSADDT